MKDKIHLMAVRNSLQGVCPHSKSPLTQVKDLPTADT